VLLRGTRLPRRAERGVRLLLSPLTAALERAAAAARHNHSLLAVARR
jgi:hypothetical protein